MTAFDVRLNFDHLVHAVHDPEEVRLAFARALNMWTVPGGEHPLIGTQNALAYFGLSYIEWIGVKDPVKAAAHPFGAPVLQACTRAPGPFWFALRTDQMDELAAAWQASGLAFAGPLAASRQLPDGRMLRWRMLFPKQQRDAPLLPFVIEWEQADEKRLDDLRTRGALPPDFAATRPQIKALHIAVQDLTAFGEKLDAYLPGIRHQCDDRQYGQGLVFAFGDVPIYCWHADNVPELAQSTGSKERPFAIEIVRKGPSVCAALYNLQVSMQSER